MQVRFTDGIVCNPPRWKLQRFVIITLDDYSALMSGQQALEVVSELLKLAVMFLEKKVSSVSQLIVVTYLGQVHIMRCLICQYLHFRPCQLCF